MGMFTIWSKYDADRLRTGFDILIVWRLDRLSRSLTDLIEMVTRLDSLDIGLKSLYKLIDTTPNTQHRHAGISPV